MFSGLKALVIPEGNVIKVAVKNGMTLWEKVKELVFTNLVPTAVDNDGSLYNGMGYKNGTYLSSSGWHNTSSDANCVTTGYIPYTLNADGTAPAIYVKGCTIDTTSHVRFCSYNELFEWQYPAYSTGDFAWGKYFSFEQLGEQYYKITPLKVSYVKNYIRMSVKGSGENLIVTVNEPIS